MWNKDPDIDDEFLNKSRFGFPTPLPACLKSRPAAPSKSLSPAAAKTPGAAPSVLLPCVALLHSTHVIRMAAPTRADDCSRVHTR